MAEVYPEIFISDVLTFLEEYGTENEEAFEMFSKKWQEYFTKPKLYLFIQRCEEWENTLRVKNEWEFNKSVELEEFDDFKISLQHKMKALAVTKKHLWTLLKDFDLDSSR